VERKRDGEMKSVSYKIHVIVGKKKKVLLLLFVRRQQERKVKKGKCQTSPEEDKSPRTLLCRWEGDLPPE
jgi:hypothetical protein